MKPDLARDYRKPRRAITIRQVVGILLTVILLSEGYWGWALLTGAGAVANFGLARLALSENFGVIKKGHHVEQHYEFPVHPVHLACGAICRLHQWVGRSHHGPVAV